MSATHVSRIFIKASAEQIWAAITTPDWTRRYGYQAPHSYDLRPGGAFAVHSVDEYGAETNTIIDGEVLAAEAPHELVQTWRARWIADEPATRLTWELVSTERGVCVLTLTHELDGAPNTAAMASGVDITSGGGWPMILSDLKTLLETGKSMNS